MTTITLSPDVEARLARNEKKFLKLLEMIEQTPFTNSDMPPTVHREIDINLSVERAKDIIQDNICGWQRELNSPKVLEYATKMRDGRFIKAIVGIATFEGQSMVVNGQHVSIATVLANLKVGPFVDILHYECDTAEQLSCLWSQWDTGNSRTSRQMAASYVSVVGPQWSADSISTFAVGFAILEHGMRGQYNSAITKEERLKLLSKHMELANTALPLVYPEGEKSSLLAKGAVISVILMSIKDDEEKAIEFWNLVRTGLGLDIGDENHPAYKLRSYLESSSRGRLFTTKGKTVQTSVDIHDRCLSAWNAFRDGRTLGNLRGTKAKTTKKSK